MRYFILKKRPNCSGGDVSPGKTGSGVLQKLATAKISAGSPLVGGPGGAGRGFGSKQAPPTLLFFWEGFVLFDADAFLLLRLKVAAAAALTLAPSKQLCITVVG